jgi:3D (Asp-Asp-Asp) domain-containing protein
MTWQIGSRRGDEPSISSVTTRCCLAAPGLVLALAAPALAQDQHAHMSMHRDTLTTGTATGSPDGGSWSYATTVVSGTTVGTLTSPDSSANPNMLSLPDPPNPSQNGAPSPGGFGQYTVTYTVNGQSVQGKGDDPFKIPTFGMSCYFTTLESDWGDPTVKNGCKSVKIHGTRYSGTITDPYGYKGTYCAAFIAEVVLQGSGTLDSGQDIQYNASKITNVKEIHGADGTPVVADKTVARDRAIIPAKGVKVSIDQVGNDLLANDTGGAIKGYRIDLYRGSGKSVCDGYSNVMGISACQPGQPACSRFAFPGG